MDKYFGDISLKVCTRKQGWFQKSKALYPWIRSIQIEGQAPVILNPDGIVDVFIDPLDGSLNYLKDPHGKLFQHGFVCTMVFAKKNPLFCDIVGALIVNMSQQHWAYAVSLNGEYIFRTKGRNVPICALGHEWNPGQNLHIWEAYYPQMRAFIAWATENKYLGKGWFRNPGSAACEMLAVSTGIAASMVCDRQKMHELGAGWLLVKANCGVGLNLETGKDLDETSYNFSAQVPMALAATPTIAEGWVKLYQEFKSQDA